MKAIVVIFLLVLGAIGAVVGQVSPIKKVIPNHNYSISELREFIDSNDPIVLEWEKTYVSLAQDALLKCGEDLFFMKNQSLREMTLFIIDHSVLTVVDLKSGFLNSGKTVNNQIKFVIDPRDIDDALFLSFEYGSCHKDLIKMNCFNTPNLPERRITPRETKKEVIPERKIVYLEDDDWYQVRKKPAVEQQVNPTVIPLCPEKKSKNFFQTDVGKVLVGSAILTGIGVGVKYIFFNKTPVAIDTGGPVGAPGYPAYGFHKTTTFTPTIGVAIHF